MSPLLLLLVFQGTHPPFKKVYTLPAEDSENDSYAAQGDWIYAGRGRVYLKIDGRNGKAAWRQSAPSPAKESGVLVPGPRVFVLTDSDKGWVMEVSPATGKPLWKVPRKGAINTMAGEGRFLVHEGPYGTVSAVDVTKRKTLWSRRVPGKKAGSGLTNLVVRGDKVFAGTWEGDVVAMDLATGKPVWTRAVPNTSYPLLDVAGGVALVGGVQAGLKGLSAATGAPLWERSDIAKSAGAKAVGDMAFVTNGNALLGISPQSGKNLWAIDLPTPIGQLDRASPVRDGVLVARSYNALYAIDKMGKQRWRWPLDEDDSGGVVGVFPGGFAIGGDFGLGTSTTGNPLYGFAMGQELPLPQTLAEREALARKLIAQMTRYEVDEQRDIRKLGEKGIRSGGAMKVSQAYAEKSRNTLRQLRNLGHDALGPILERYVEASKADVAQGDKPGSNYYSILTDLARLSAEIATPADTERLLAAFHAVPRDSFGGFNLLRVIVERGDPTLATPTYVQVLQSQRTSASSSWTEAQAALDGIVISPAPAATEYLIAQLRDPKASTDIRQAAYVSLARYGGVEARQAVLEFRTKRQPFPPLANLMELDKLPAQPAKDRDRYVNSRLVAVQGEWGLVACGVYGGYDDLFLVKREGDRWTYPVFTGVGRTSSRRDSREKAEQGRKAYEATQKDWFKTFVGNAKLAVDTDGDGLTDLAEARLGTDKAKPDTDGDGLKDAGDQNPLVAARELTDEEAMLATAFEARYRFVERHITPSIVTYPGAPFELLGQDGYILPEKRAGSAETMFGLGPAYVHIEASGPMRDDSPGRPPQPVRPVPEGAKQVSVGTTYAGLNGTGYVMSLQKFDGVWFLVESYMEWIS